MEQLAHRKGKQRIRIAKSGQSLSNEPVKVEQIHHDFLFGAAGFDLMQMYTTNKEEERTFFKERVDKTLDVFNYITLPMYWGVYEPVEGETGLEVVKAASEYLKKRDVAMKGHPLCWHTVCADWLLNYSDRVIWSKQMQRIQREVSDFSDSIGYWDVINETVIMPEFDKYDNAVSRICNRYGRMELIKNVFATARETNPSAKLILNDFNTTVAYEKVIEECLSNGVQIDVIGIQSHQHQGYWGKEKLEDVLDRFSKYKIPIHFTENTIISGTLIPDYIEDLNDWQVSDWPSTKECEELQLKQTKEMYEILFAHPMVEAITWWDFADGAWLNAPSGLIRKDNSPKPVYNMLKEKICQEWMTRYTCKTDENGLFTLEGFYGDYEITVGNVKRRIHLSDANQNLEEVNI